MPLYTYRRKKDGTLHVRMRPIAKRDTLRGHVRVPEFSTAMPPGLAVDPNSEASASMRCLRETEEKHGLDAIRRDLGPDLTVEEVKRTWSN